MHPNYKFYYTFIMLKPDALKRNLVFDIMEYFTRRDMVIEKINYKIADSDLIRAHYSEIINSKGDDFFNKLKKYMDNQPVIPIILKSIRPDIIEYVRSIVGETNPKEADKGTIRGDLGIDSYQKCNAQGRTCENLIHASDSPKAVRREIAIWFGDNIQKEILTDDWFLKGN